MPLYVKVDVNFRENPKVLSVRPEAQLVYLRGLMWSKQHLTDGRIPKSFVPMLCVQCVKGKQIPDELVAARLWVVDGDAYRVPLEKWREWQNTAEEVAEKRAQNAERVRRSRAKKRECNSVTGALLTPAVTPRQRQSTETETEYRVNTTAPAAAVGGARVVVVKAEDHAEMVGRICAVLMDEGFSPGQAMKHAKTFAHLGVQRVQDVCDYVAEGMKAGRLDNRQGSIVAALQDNWETVRPEDREAKETETAKSSAMAAMLEGAGGAG